MLLLSLKLYTDVTHCEETLNKSNCFYFSFSCTVDTKVGKHLFKLISFFVHTHRELLYKAGVLSTSNEQCQKGTEECSLTSLLEN